MLDRFLLHVGQVFFGWYSESRWYNFVDTCDDLSISPIGGRGLNSKIWFNIIFGVYG